jgi:two-component system phosphate regulon response regulator PhoB
MTNNVLLVDDNESTCLLVKAMLGPNTQFRSASDTTQALRLLEAQRADLLLLDVDLPGEDGFQFCAKLRADRRYLGLPIVFLTGKSSLSEKVFGFSLGADDYVTKPFNTIELKARIEAKLRRTQERASALPSASLGNFEADLHRQKLALKEPEGLKWLSLTTTEYRLLNHLLHHPDRIFTRNQLLDEVWGNEAHVSDRTIDAHIYMIRQKLGAKAGFIKAVKGIGYMLSQKENVGG